MADEFTPDGTITSHDPPNSYDPDQFKSGVETLSIEQRMQLAGFEPIMDEPQWPTRAISPAVVAKPALDRPIVFGAVIEALRAVEELAKMSVSDYLNLTNTVTDLIMEGLT